jgi:DNA-binding protein H-NS
MTFGECQYMNGIKIIHGASLKVYIKKLKVNQRRLQKDLKMARDNIKTATWQGQGWKPFGDLTI